MPPVPGTTAVECGQPFQLPTGGRLIVTGRFPNTAPAAARVVTGTVEVTCPVALRGVVAPSAEVFLVRGGRVATLPMPQDLTGIRWDLAAGETGHLTGQVTLRSCAPAGGSVPAGRYELYARVVLTPDDGPGEESFGGPWPVEIQ